MWGQRWSCNEMMQLWGRVHLQQSLYDCQAQGACLMYSRVDEGRDSIQCLLNGSRKGGFGRGSCPIQLLPELLQSFTSISGNLK